jgi:IrrE N-terminal-like domain
MSKFWDEVPVPPIALDRIEALGSDLRNLAKATVEDRLIIDPLLQSLGIELEVESDRWMGRAIALASRSKEQKRIHVRRSLSKALRDDDDEARFILFHEIGHLFLHRGAEMKPRIVDGNHREAFIRAEESAEIQADTFARSFALPRNFPWWNKADELIGKIVGIPERFVRERRSEIEPKASLSKLYSELGIMRGDAALNRTKFYSRETLASVAIQKHELWDKLPIIDGEDPALYRRCGMYQIAWKDYGKPNPPSQMGWLIRDGRIRSYFEMSSR